MVINNKWMYSEGVYAVHKKLRSTWLGRIGLITLIFEKYDVMIFAHSQNIIFADKIRRYT